MNLLSLIELIIGLRVGVESKFSLKLIFESKFKFEFL